MAQYEDLQIDQGSDVLIKLELTEPGGGAKDLTGHTGAAQLRKTYTSKDSDATTFVAAVDTPATGGVLNLSLTNSQTDALKPGRYVYDVELRNTDSAGTTLVERILEGQIIVTPSVTKSA